MYLGPNLGPKRNITEHNGLPRQGMTEGREGLKYLTQRYATARTATMAAQ